MQICTSGLWAMA